MFRFISVEASTANKFQKKSLNEKGGWNIMLLCPVRSLKL